MEPHWDPESFDFDKTWNPLLYLLKGNGFKDIAGLLEYDISHIKYKHLSISINYLDSYQIKILHENMQETSESILKKAFIYNGNVKNPDGEVFTEWDISNLFLGYDEFVEFFKKTAKNNDYLKIISS